MIKSTGVGRFLVECDGGCGEKKEYEAKEWNNLVFQMAEDNWYCKKDGKDLKFYCEDCRMNIQDSENS